MRRLLSFSSVVLLTLLFAPAQAHAATIVLFGTNHGSDATATADFTLVGDSLNLSLTNTSPYSADVTGFGLDLVAGDSWGKDGLDGFTGDPTLVGGFTFSDGNLGNVPEYSDAVLDFGYLTGNNFGGGFAQDGIAPGETLRFMVGGDFGGLTEAEIAAALYVRFQEVGENGRFSDVATVNPTPVPEPASMLLLGSGLAAVVARRRLRKRQTA